MIYWKKFPRYLDDITINNIQSEKKNEYLKFTGLLKENIKITTLLCIRSKKWQLKVSLNSVQLQVLNRVPPETRTIARRYDNSFHYFSQNDFYLFILELCERSGISAVNERVTWKKCRMDYFIISILSRVSGGNHIERLLLRWI